VVLQVQKFAPEKAIPGGRVPNPPAVALASSGGFQDIPSRGNNAVATDVGYSPSSIHTIYERTRLLEASLGASKTGVHTT
jgi:hypothetical protein